MHMLLQRDRFFLYVGGIQFLGVIWSGDEAIPGAAETIKYLEQAGWFIIILIFSLSA